MPKNVLVADDSLTMRKVISLVLAPDDFRLIEVGNGTDALAKAQEMSPDMVLLDGSMPGKDGFEVCAALKKNPKTAHIPILLLVNGQDAIDEEKVRSVLADDYIAKPFESQALLDKACSLLKMPLVAPLPIRGSAAAAASRLQPVSTPPTPTPPAFETPAAPPTPALSEAPVVPPVPAIPAAPTFVPPPAPPLVPLSSKTELSPAFLQPPPPSPPSRATPTTSFAAPSFSMSPPAPASTREPVPRTVPPRGTSMRVPGAPLFGPPPALPSSPVAPELQALPMSSSPARPGFVPTFPPARSAPPPAYGTRPPPAYGTPAPMSPRPLPLTQPFSRTAAAPPTPFMSRPALPKSTSAPAPSFFPPAGRPAAPASPAYRPAPYARSPVPSQTPASMGMRRDDPFGLRGPPTPVSQVPPSALNPEAALRELLPLISKELLEKVIWEVVPQLAETMIREHIERLIQAKERGQKDS